MKILFIIFLLISTSMITSSKVALDKQQSDFIDLINEKRRAFAIEEKFENMHKVDWDQGLQKLLDQSDQTTLSNMSNSTKMIHDIPIKSMDQEGINKLMEDRGEFRRVSMNTWLTTVTCVRRATREDYDYTFSTFSRQCRANELLLVNKTDCLDGFKYDLNGLCVKPSTQIATTKNPVNPNNNSNVLPTSVVPKIQTNQPANPSTPSNPNPTLPGPKNSENSNSRKMKLSPETRTLPKELADYVEVDGDDYDEDFPTGEQLLDSGFETILQFWITVVLVTFFVSWF